MSALEIVTTSTGYFKAGVRGVIVAGGERVVFLGQPAQRTVLPEFTLEFTDEKGKTWRKEYCQYGRDFRFAHEMGVPA